MPRDSAGGFSSDRGGKGKGAIRGVAKFNNVNGSSALEGNRERKVGRESGKQWGRVIKRLEEAGRLWVYIFQCSGLHMYWSVFWVAHVLGHWDQSL